MAEFVAVIDLGKTNKKIVLFDRKLKAVAVRQANFPAKMGPDGILVEQLEAIWLWLTRELATLYREHRFHALSVTTHGATFAALDQTGRPCLPVIAYEHDLGPAGQAGLDEDFYRLCGPVAKLQEETGTCDLPLLVNPAKAIRFAQRRLPGQWARVRRLLDYPQFWGYLLTGEMATEPTYTANHSFLFDPRTRGPSSAAKALGADKLIDWNLRSPWERLGVLRGDLQRELGLPALPVTVGIHDSNAALLTYLIKFGDQDFVLNSTGTWCVAMHRVEDLTYRPEEIGQKVIFNIDALGKYQKSSFLMGGMDYALYHDCIGGKDPGLDLTRLEDSLADHDRAFMPGAYPSQFPKVRGGTWDGATNLSVDHLRAGRKPSWFASRETAHDLLNVSLALQSELALRRTDIKDGTTIFVEGGFRNNTTFLTCLAALFPKNPVSVTNLAQASAAGAALLGHALLSHCHPRSLANAISIDVEEVTRESIPGLTAYRSAWLAMAHGAAPEISAKSRKSAADSAKAAAKQRATIAAAPTPPPPGPTAKRSTVQAGTSIIKKAPVVKKALPKAPTAKPVVKADVKPVAAVVPKAVAPKAAAPTKPAAKAKADSPALIPKAPTTANATKPTTKAPAAKAAKPAAVAKATLPAAAKTPAKTKSATPVKAKATSKTTPVSAKPASVKSKSAKQPAATAKGSAAKEKPSKVAVPAKATSSAKKPAAARTATKTPTKAASKAKGRR